MSQNPELSPRAQAILRAIENEAHAQRQSGAVPARSAAAAELPDPPVTFRPGADSADQLTRLVDHVVAQTENMRAHFRQVEQSLEALSGALATGATPDALPDLSRDRSSEARLVAVELALSGRSRGEVAEHLVRELSIGDPARILDDIFGMGSADSARTPWNG